MDFDANTVYICRNVQYSPDVGVYVTTPKTKTSIRTISVPADTVKHLRQYKAWQGSEKIRLGAYYEDQGYLFAQDNGSPMHPDSVTDFMKKFAKRHGLPHINPHAFRHTMASALYFGGADSVSISKRLGHAQVSLGKPWRIFTRTSLPKRTRKTPTFWRTRSCKRKHEREA